MAWEDWFLRLDPYNFETKEQQEEFFKPTETAEKEKAEARASGERE